MAGLGSLTIDLAANITRFEKALSRAERVAQKRSQAINRVFVRLSAGLGAFLGGRLIAQGIDNFVETAKVFEQSMADLSAITGATGKDLEYLSDAAKEFGVTTTLSASQAAEAFKLVASAKPDLLDNLDALKKVTEQTIILSEASGLDLASSAMAAGEALNQYGAGAEQAARFVNVLAAGSKYGASEIADTAAALSNVGVVAKNAGLSFEETNASLQILAQGGIKATKAGTGLRTVLLKLETQTNDQFKPSVVGVSQAFENLSKAQLSATAQAKLYGTEGITVAQILTDNAAKLDTMTKKLTGTKVATEQARVRTNTFAGKIKELQSAYEGLTLTINDSNGPLKTFVEFITRGIRGTSDFIKSFDKPDVSGLDSINLAIEKIERRYNDLQHLRDKGLLSPQATTDALEEQIKLEKILQTLYKQREESQTRGPTTRAKINRGRPSELKDDLETGKVDAEALQELLDKLYPDQAAKRKLEEHVKLIRDAKLPADETANAIKLLNEEFRSTSEAGKLYDKLFPDEAAKKRLADSIALVKALRLPADQAAQAIAKLNEEYRKTSEAGALYDRLFPNQALARELEYNTQLIKSMKLPTDQEYEALKRLQEEFAKSTGGPRKLSNATEDAADSIKESIKEAGETIKDSISNSIAAAELSLESLEKLGISVAQNIAKSLIQTKAVSPIVDYLTNLATTYATSSGTSTATTSTSYGGNPPRRAAGGTVEKQRTYLVGERGPELLVMGEQEGEIIPNGKMVEFLKKLQKKVRTIGGLSQVRKTGILSGVDQRAAGGQTTAGRTYLVGERGPELLTTGKSTGGDKSAADQSPIINIVNYTGGDVKTRKSSSGNGREIIDIIIGTVAADIARGGDISRTLQANYSGIYRRGVLRA